MNQHGLSGRPAPDANLRGLPRAVGGDRVVQRSGVDDRRAIDRRHEITLFQTGSGRRALRPHVGDQGAGRRGQAHRLCDVGGHTLQARAQPRPNERTAAADSGLNDPAHHRRRNGETDPR